MVVFPHREIPRQQHVRDVVRIRPGQVWQLDREVGSRGEQVLLATEVTDHQRRIHTDVRRDGAQGGAFKTFRRETAARRREDVGASLGGVTRPFGTHPKTLCQPLLTSGIGPAYCPSHRMLTKVTDC